MGFINTQIFYLIHKTKVKDLSIARDFFRSDVFVRSNNFLDRDDRLRSIFFKSPASGVCVKSTCANNIYTKGTFSGGICTKAASIKSACTGSSYTIGLCTKEVCTKDICLGSTGTRDTCTGGTYARSACIKDAGPVDTGTEGAGTESTCTGGVGVVKYSRIHLQS